MFLKSDADIIKLIKSVRQCKGDVHLLTEEGDNMNLKSKICQYVAIAMVAKPELLVRAQIVCDNKEDEPVLGEFVCE